MPFTKGQKKSGGRVKGVSNKSTKELQDRLKLIIDENLELLMEDFRSLESLERVKTLSAYLKYVMPQQKESSVDLNAELNNGLDEDTLNKIVNGMNL